MKIYKIRVSLLPLLIFLLFFISFVSNAQVIKTTIGDILVNPDKYDGKIVEVKGIAMSVKFKISKRGNPYTTFKLTDDSNTLTVFSFGTLPIYEKDKVKVIGKYQKVKYVGGYVFYNEIDASAGKVESVR